MDIMSLMATIGIDLKQFQRDLGEANRLTERFKKSSELSELDFGINVDTGRLESDLEEIASMAASAQNDISIEADADINTSDYIDGIGDLVEAAGGAAVDVSGDADLNTTDFTSNVDVVEKDAAGAEADVDGEADLDVTSFAEALSGVEADASGANADIDGVASLDGAAFTDAVSALEMLASGASVDVDGEADLTTSAYDDALSGIVSDAKDANVDVSGTATLADGGYDSTLAGIVEQAAGADADVSATASLDTSGYDDGIEHIIGLATQADTDASVTATASIDVSGVQGDIAQAITDVGTLQSGIDTATEKAKATDESINQIGTQVNFQGVIEGLGAIDSALTGIIRTAAQAGRALLDMSVDASVWADTLITESQEYSTAGFDTQMIQQMRYASRFIDTNVSTIETATQRLTNNMTSSSSTAMAAFEQLGVSITDEAGNMRDAIDVFWDIIDAAKQMTEAGNATEAQGLIMDTLGRNAAELGPLILAGSDAYKELMATAPVVTQEAVTDLGTFNDAIQDLESNLEVTKMEALGQLAPALTEAATALTEFITSAEGKESVQKITDAVVSLVESLTSEENLSAIFSTVTGAVEQFTGALEWIGTNSTTVVGAFEGIAGAIAAIKVGEGVLNFLKLVQGAKGLFTGGAGAEAVSTATNTALTVGAGSAFGTIAAGALPLAYGVGSVAVGGKLLYNLATARERDYGEYFDAIENADDAQASLDAYNQALNNTEAELREFVDASQESGIALGETGDEIAEIQKMLVENGYDIGAKGVDSIFGKDTQKAYEQYLSDQRDNALAAIEEVNSQQSGANAFGDILSNALSITENDASTQAEVKEQAAAFLDQYGAAIEEAFPDIDLFSQLHDRLGEDLSGFSFADLLENNSEVMGLSGWDTVMEDVVANMINALTSAGENENFDIFSHFIGEDTSAATDTLDTIFTDATDTLSTETQTGLTEGGEAGGAAIETSMIEHGEAAVSAIQDLLNSLRFPSFTVDASSRGSSNNGKLDGTSLSFRKDLNSRAMYGGRILHGLTPFGISADGAIQYGGESGAEAVVGVNSLDRMIQESVNNAVAGILGRMDNMQDRPISVNVTLDSRQLATELAPNMDTVLGSRSNWRKGGRA